MADLRVPGALDSPEVLVRLALEGDRTAFARIVRLHRTDMVRVAWVVTLDPRLAEEAVAAAWPMASNRLGRLGEPARLGPWLCALAAREARSAAARWSGHRHGSPRHAPGPARDDPDYADPVMAGFLGQLTADERLLLALRHLAGSTPGEVAAAAGHSTDSLSARMASIEERFAEDGQGELADRLRAFASIRVRHLDIDAEARRAFATRNDRRIRIASLVIAAIVAVVVVSIPYVIGTNEPGLPGAIVSPSPSAPADAEPGTPESGS